MRRHCQFGAARGAGLALWRLPASQRRRQRRGTGQEPVRRQEAAGGDAGASPIGFYSKGCFSGGVAIATDGPTWQAMRPVAQPPLGPSDDDRADRETVARRGRRRLAGPVDRRHFAAARRPDADRPCLAPDRPRRRHLADADAQPHAFGDRAREHERHLDGRRKDLTWSTRRAVDAGAYAAAEARGELSAKSSASWSIPASRRSSATPSPATAPGCARSGRSGATTIISTSASAASRARPTARRRKRPAPATAATSRWPGGSPRSRGGPTRTPTRRRRAT